MTHSKIKQQLENLSPRERLDFIAEVLDTAILMTPSGPERNAMTSANIALLEEKERITH